MGEGVDSHAVFADLYPHLWEGKFGDLLAHISSQILADSEQLENFTMKLVLLQYIMPIIIQYMLGEMSPSSQKLCTK